MKHFEKTLSSDTVYEGEVFTVTRDRVELENGACAFREVVHHRGGACVAALTEKGEVLIVRQFRYPYKEELLELPAGKLEAGEAPLSAAKRELREEAGVTADHYIDLGRYYPTCGYCGEVIYLYGAKGLHFTDAAPDEDEFLTLGAMPLEELCENCLSGEVPDGKTAVCALRLKHVLEKGAF